MKLSLRTLLGRAYALVLALLGTVLLLGGVKLLLAGGSLWYAAAGILLLICAALQWHANRWAMGIYGLLLIGTAIWSVWEVGLDAWALLPRLGTLSALGLWFLPPRAWRAVIVLAAVAIAAVGLMSIHASPAAAPVAEPMPSAAESDWRNYGNGPDGTRYSPLAQLQPGNVRQLKLAWSFRTADVARQGGEYNFEATALKVGSLLYACTPGSQVVALEAATGQLRWRFNAGGGTNRIHAFPCRGVSYYAIANESGPCSQRIYVATPDNNLWGIDALNGSVCSGFGSNGGVDLLSGLGSVIKGQYAVTSPPVVTHGKLVLGASVADNVSTDMPSGVVRAYDAVTGTLAWAWDVGRPGHHGAPALGDTYTRSTPNAWVPLVADDALGLVYVPTGNSSPDFWGRLRRTFDEKYAVSLVALSVETGEPQWHFQFVHHDLWDLDLSSQPVLVDVPGAHGAQPAIIVGTKQGGIYVLNRVTGAPLVPVTEIPAPGPSNIGERLSPTQPESALTLNPGPRRLTEASMWGITPVDQMWCRLRFRQSRYDGPFTPPGTGMPTIAYPGMFGGIEWSGLTVDPVRKILIANPNAMPFVVQMARLPAAAATGLSEIKGTGHAVSNYAFLSPLKIPCLQPPWGELYAVDLSTLTVLWHHPVGTARDTGPFGIASQLPLRIGTPQVGGSIVTRGGLVFSAATLDRYLRAYDLNSGAELWRTRLPAGGQATPMTYEADGRQFVVIAAGGHSGLNTKGGDYLLAYALP
jgi:quinoprotein glucose dehydrogenase